MDWKSMPEGKEKYQAYLCSREWGLKKEAVRKRCGGICERCCVNEMDHTHHLTYARKYNEPLEDLRALCKPCHEYTHGKAGHDPATFGRVKVAGRFVKTFYLAGKISGNDWRDEIVANWSEENHSEHNRRAMIDYHRSKLWAIAPRSAVARNGVMLDYAGPWWSPAYGGHGSSGFFRSPHAYMRRMWEETGDTADDDDRPTPKLLAEIRKNIDKAIGDSDLVFAWIDSADCFGTLVELGIAAASKKAIIVAFSEAIDLSEFWLAASYANEVIVAKTAGEAWAKAWGIKVPIHSQEAI
jgi:hypothetical protein